MGNLKNSAPRDYKDSNVFNKKSSLKSVKEDDLDSLGDNDQKALGTDHDFSDRQST